MALNELKRLIETGRQDAFYHWPEWEEMRERVLALDHYECQICKKKGRYSAAQIVHHVKHLRDRPDLALSLYDGEERQLLSVCKSCHLELHPEQMAQCFIGGDEPVTEERWD